MAPKSSPGKLKRFREYITKIANSSAKAHWFQLAQEFPAPQRSRRTLENGPASTPSIRVRSNS
jgi:hypothetical protein